MKKKLKISFTDEDGVVLDSCELELLSGLGNYISHLEFTDIVIDDLKFRIDWYRLYKWIREQR